MQRIIKETLRSCDTCQKCKYMNYKNHGDTKGVPATKRNELLAIDFLGPLPTGKFGLQYILVTVDVFTKFTKLYAVKKANTNTVLRKIFVEYIPNYGKPEKIQSDNATQFRSHKWTNKLQEENIKVVFSPIRHPQPNLAERIIKETKRCLRTYCYRNQKSWTEYLEVINEFLNEMRSETTGYTPNELHLGKENKRFWSEIVKRPERREEDWEVKVELAKTRAQRKKEIRAAKENENHRHVTFKLHELVLLKAAPVSKAIAGETKGLCLLYEGPYKIHKVLGRATYLLCDPDGENVKGPYHVEALKKYY